MIKIHLEVNKTENMEQKVRNLKKKKSDQIGIMSENREKEVGDR